ncbi:MAG: DUF4239 domain-containing protein [Burkholderiales bacterium]|nr:DUF4239 domain-containing protein [Burkholderiales bacterium]MBK8664557.1 DUF4239 domain-containing protein [Burkholderiales bacterium]
MFNYSALPDWYDWAYALSEAGLLLISLLATLFIGVLASLVVALYRGRPGRAKPSSMPPGFLTGIVLPVSVVLGLLVNDVWRKYDDAHDVVLQEAAIVADLVRVIQLLPESAAEEMGALLYGYVHGDVPSDWRAFQSRTLPPVTRSALAEMTARTPALQRQYRGDGATSHALELLARDIATLDKTRKARINLSMGRMDNTRWFVLALLMFSCLVMLVEVVYGQWRNHLLVLVLFALGYGSLAYMVLTHDRPYTGATIASHAPITAAYVTEVQALKNRP